MKRIHAAIAVAVTLIFANAVAEPITVDEAVRRAVDSNAELTATAAELRASEAAARQARRLPNPDIELSVENAGADDVAMETTASAAQLLELGGDRRARIDVAGEARTIASFDHAARRLDVEARVRGAFAALVSAQQHVAIARENVTSAESAFGAIRDRVSAGKVSPIEETRAGVTLSMERIELTRAEAELASARVHLAAMWGGGGGDLVADASPSAEPRAAAIDGNPEILRSEAVVVMREAEARLERASAMPDLRASAGVRDYEDGSGPAAVASVSMSLPLFDRNRDAITAARARVEAARADAAAVRVRFARDLDEAQLRRASAEQNVERYRAEIVPAAESVYEAISEGYRLGKFGYLEVLDARRTLAQARQQLVSAQRELELARIDVAKLTGGWK